MDATEKKPFFKTIFGKTIVGIFLGILVGIFFGEDAEILKPFGFLYVTLMQIVIYPYIICTLLSSLGKLSPSVTLALSKRGGLIFLIFLIVCFSVIGILTLAIPSSVSLGQTALPTEPQANLLTLLFTTNVFSALAQNQLPAVIIFCIILALMLQRMPATQGFFSVLDLIGNACVEFWRFLVRIAPVAIFTIIANFAGTVKLSQLAGTGLFLFLFFVGTFMLAFWLLPVMITCLIPIRYKDLMLQLRDGLITAASTSLVLVLPFVQSVANKILHVSEEKNENNNDTTKQVIETNLILGYSFATAGAFFTYLFIVFAALYFNHPLQASDKFVLPIITFFAGVGGPNAAVLYMTSWLQLPKDTLDLFFSIFPVIQFALIIVSSMGIAFFTIIISGAYAKKLHFQPLKLLMHFFLALIVLLLAIQIKHWVPDPAQVSYQRLMSDELAQDLTQGLKVTIANKPDEARLIPPHNPEDSLYKIQKSDVLRVGFNPNIIPFSFFNIHHHLVGYDVAFMYALAEALDAKLVFIPYTIPYLFSDLENDAFDIAISGLFISEASLPYISFSEPYFKTMFSFIIPRTEQGKFANLDTINAISDLRIGVLGIPSFISLIKGHFPRTHIVVVDDSPTAIENAFKNNQIDAYFGFAVTADPWILNHPQYISVTPAGLSAPFSLAYMVQKTSPQFLNFLNYWLKLKADSYLEKRTYKHWILIHPIPDTSPRWSIIRDVLHWR